MEEISSAIAVPFMLGNLIYDESSLTSHMEIAGLDLIANQTSLLSETPATRLPMLSMGVGNESYDCSNPETEAAVARVPLPVSDFRDGRKNTNAVTGNGSALLPCISSDLCDRDRAGSEEDPVAAALQSRANSDKNSSNVGAVADSDTWKREECVSFASGAGDDKRISRTGSRSVSESQMCRVPLWGFTSVCGKMSEMEDAIAALPSFLRIPTMGIDQDLTHIAADFFGVYDGHGGCQVANYCRDRIHLALAEELETAKDNFHNGSTAGNWQEQWEKAFLNCFQRVDAEVGGLCEGRLEPVAPDAVGSTAVVAIVCPTHLVVANCGDSRAVLCRGKAPLPLSVDHKPNREDERARIEAAGGKVIQWDGFRVSGVLAMSRSIGDRYLEPYVIPDPEMMLVPRKKEDECLILASDGLWDVMTNEEVCDVARKRILLWHKRNGDSPAAGERGKGADPASQDAAEYLSRVALHRGSRDNISVIVVDLKAKRKFKRKS
ncbi:protein phosphatase 2C 77-like [Diospyros lotus]|uniref:protein phosphatase 2C 77-like n=1 Tax=Diospyros lotus TaxID=55363 RepID=UPI0022530682|nr:protein phosphatase 2C 77-like [Diospyros lotus]XP_052180902.1 protein phosphatase 2C 77-like [Diospyros lotus]